MLQCNTNDFLIVRILCACMLTTLLGWSCHSVPPENSLQEMKAQQQDWESTVTMYEADLAKTATSHKQFMLPFQDTLPSPAREKFINDSLFRVEVGRLDVDYSEWAAQQVIATRDLRRFVQKTTQWLSRVVNAEIPADKASTSWKSRLADFNELREHCVNVQLQYPPLAARYHQAGN